MLIEGVLVTCILSLVTGNPIPFPYPYPAPYPYPYPAPMPDPQGCCMPSPMCMNPCPMPPPMQMAPMQQMQQDCCMPGPQCANPCFGSMMYQPQAQPMPLGYQKSRNRPVVYAPLPGEIVFKLIQNWDADYLDNMSPGFQILEGNVRRAIQAVLGPNAQVTNIYFREGYVPGNPPSRPKTVAHMMVNGGSDAASILEHSVTPDGSLGDGLKVYKDSFNAY